MILCGEQATRICRTYNSKVLLLLNHTEARGHQLFKQMLTWMQAAPNQRSVTTPDTTVNGGHLHPRRGRPVQVEMEAVWTLYKTVQRASLVAQCLRIHLLMQGTWVRALVQEDPTCRRATKPVCHNCWAREPQLLKPARLESVLRNKRSHRNEKPAHRNEEKPQLAATRESPREATKTQCNQK